MLSYFYMFPYEIFSKQAFIEKNFKILLIQIEPGIAPRIFDMNMFEYIKFIGKKNQNILNPNIAWYILE